MCSGGPGGGPGLEMKKIVRGIPYASLSGSFEAINLQSLEAEGRADSADQRADSAVARKFFGKGFWQKGRDYSRRSDESDSL